MSDTLPEREDQMDGEQYNQIRSEGAGWLECCQGYTHAPWCSAYKESNTEYQRSQFPVGAVIEAITPIGRSQLRDDVPKGTRGKVTSHCDDGRAWVFFDGYDEGHTFHEIEKFLRVVQLPVKEVGDECADDCHFGDPDQPATRGGGDGDKWSIKVHGNEIDADLLINGSYVGTLHADKAKQVLDEHNQHQALAAERERLRAAIEVAIHNLNAGNDPKFLADYLQLTLN